MTPPPTSAERPPRRRPWFVFLREKAIEAYYLVEDVVPRPADGNAWLRLFRAPNLLTVPGDVLAGFLLAPAAGSAPWSRFLLALPAGLLLYAAGLALNDLFDYAEDLRDRPDRPLPSGAIARETAAAVALVFIWIAGFLAAFAGALAIVVPLVGCVVVYNVGLKRHAALGPLFMGACRAGNLLLGAAAASGAWFAAPGPWLGALALGLYVAGVTRLARDETAPNAKFPPARIGQLLGLLIPLQALLGVAAVHRFPANLLALVLLPLAPLRRRLARRYPPS